MPRESYYQSVGNPIQVDRLPAGQPTLSFAHRSPPMSAKPHCVKALQWLAGASLSALLIQFFATAYWVPWAIPAVCWLLALGLIVFATRRGASGQSRLAVDVVVTLAAALLLGRAPLMTGLSVAAVLGSLTWHFARHWSHVATAAPLPRTVAQQLRQSWDNYLLVIVAVFAIVVTAAATAGSPRLMIAVLLGLPLVSLLFGLVTQLDAASWKVCREAVLSWLTYHESDRPIPGIAFSPAGTTQGRYFFIVMATFIVALTSHQWVQAHGLYPSGLAVEVSYFSPLVVVWVPFGLAFPILIESARYRQSTVDAEAWSSVVAQMRISNDPIEKESLFMGNIVSDGSPLLVPRVILKEHAHFLGDTGSGKTSKGLAPMIEQLVGRGDCSVIFVDLKADTAEPLATLHQAAAEGRKRSGQPIPVKHFTNQIGMSTFAFNPFSQKGWNNLTLAVKADLLTNAMGLQYGVGYGESFFATANTAVLHEALKRNPHARSFRELAETIGGLILDTKSALHVDIRKAGLHVNEVAKRLASFEALNVVAGDQHAPEVTQQAIELSDYFSQPEIGYFHLSSIIAPGASADIARLVTNLLLAASTPAKRLVPVYLVIDEFQRMVANNVEAVFQLARSMGVSVILANQTLQDLKTSSVDLIAAIEANCRYRQWFSVSSTADREALMGVGGETVELFGTQTITQTGTDVSTGTSVSEQLQPRLSNNDISLASDHPSRSLVRISRGEGYAQYGGFIVEVESHFHITPEEYRRRKEFPWPTNVPGTFVPNLDSEVPPPPKKGPSITTETIG